MSAIPTESFSRAHAAPDNGTATSIAAAQSMAGSAAQQESQVLAAIRAAGIHGRTRQEIEAELGLDGSSVRPRVWSLLRRKLIAASGEIRRTASGRAAEVLVATGNSQ